MKLNLNGIHKSIKLNIDNDLAAEKLKDIIIKKGGNFWNKKGNRVYFNIDLVDDCYSSKLIPIPVTRLYFDFDNRCLRFEIAETDAEKYEENFFKDQLISILKNNKKASKNNNHNL